MRIRASLVVAAAALALLAGCIGEPAPTATPTETAEPTPTATPTPEPDARPTGTLPIACDVLVPDDVRAALFGADAGSAVPARSEAVPSLWQSGLTECRWVVAGTDAALRVWVLEDAAAAFAEARAASGATGPGSCSDGESGQECRLDDLVGGYWFDLSSNGASTLSAADLTTAVLTALTSSLGAAGAPEPRWTPPADAVALPTECSRYDGPELRAAISSPELAAAVAAPASYGSLIVEAGRRSGEVVCIWPMSASTGAGQFELMSLQGVTGSGWWWDEAIASWEANGPAIERVEIPGADGAALACQAGSCAALWLVDGTVVSASFQRYDASELDRARIVGALTAWTAAILAG